MSPLSPAEASRLIDHGLRLWDRAPRARSIEWRDDRRHYRLTATSFRFCLDWRTVQRGDPWKPGYCRWL